MLIAEKWESKVASYFAFSMHLALIEGLSSRQCGAPYMLKRVLERGLPVHAADRSHIPPG